MSFVLVVKKLLKENEVFAVVPNRERIRPKLIFRRNQIVEPVEAVVRIVRARSEPVSKRPLIEEERIPKLRSHITEKQLAQLRQKLRISGHFVQAFVVRLKQIRFA